MFNKKGQFTNLIRGGLTVLISVLIIFTIVKAGTITPPSGEPAAQFYTLSEIYTRLTTNGTATAGGHSFTFTDSLAGTGRTLTEIYNAIPTIDPSKLLSDTTYLGVTGTIATRTLSADSVTVNAGYYVATTLSGVDVDLAEGNIKKDTAIFGITGTLAPDGTAAATDCLDTKTFYSGDSWTQKTGSIATQILSADNDTVAVGYYAATTLHAVDADLATGNIKSGKTIFGIDGNGNVVDTSTGTVTDNAQIRSSYVCFSDGTQYTGSISDCSSEGGNACYAASGYWTATAGDNVTGDQGSISFSIPNGYYSGKTCTAADSDLAVGNIKSGVNILGTIGTMPPGAGLATGQVTSYATNDDGTYEKGLALSYTDNGDGTITDNNTGLMWVKEPQKIIPGAALAGIATNQIQAARGDWATATDYVLGDLVRDATGANATAMNISGATAASPCVVTVDNLQGVTSGQSVLISGITSNMGTDILNGHIYYVLVNATAKTLTLYSNAVLSTAVDTTGKTPATDGTAIQTKFYVCSTAHTSGTFTTDVGAGKWRETVWTASAANLTTPSTMAWLPTGGSADAINNCENLTYAGYTDWRLPNVKELFSIVIEEYAAIAGVKAASSPYINQTVFPNTVSSYYWSSTTYPNTTTNAFLVAFTNGSANNTTKTTSYYVRCARGQ